MSDDALPRSEQVTLELRRLAGELPQQGRPDHDASGLALAHAWLDEHDEADRALATSVLARWVELGSADEARLGCQLASRLGVAPAALAAALAQRADLPEDDRAAAAGVLARGVASGRTAWQPAWRPLLLAAGGWALLPAAVTTDHGWTMANLHRILAGLTPRAAGVVFGQALDVLNRAELDVVIGELHAAVAMAPDVAALLLKSAQWRRDQPDARDGQVRWG